MSDYNAIGRRTRLTDGREKVTGRARYATDIQIPGMLHARLVTSPYAHARLVNINTEAALAVPGVVRVLTAEDLPPVTPKSRNRLMLARERVIFVGQPVALVLAENEAAAEDGIDQVMVEYDPQPAAVTLEQAMAEGAPLVWPRGVPTGAEEAGIHGADVGGDDEEEGESSNVTHDRTYTRGEVEAGFAEADVVVEHTFTTPAVHQSYIEPQSLVAQPDPYTGGMTVWTGTQGPFYVREQVAAVLDVPDSEVRVVPTTVGGGFGGKFCLYEPLMALAAREAGRPVRLVLTRMEEMLAGNPALPARLRLKLGAKRDGTLTALEGDLVFDSGCYPGAPAGIAAVLMGSAYNIPNTKLRTREVLTFKPSTGAYRAPGAPQAFFALESSIDEVARRLDLDPLELRLRHAAEGGDEMIHKRKWNRIGMKQVLETLRAHPLWQERAAGRLRGRGVGVAIGGWPGGQEPAAAICMLNRDGQLHLHLGSVDLNGTSTGFALMAAEAFGTDPERVRVVHGDTASSPYAGGAGGSKITYSVGPAVVAAAQEARAQVLEIASEEFEAAPEDLEIVDGQVRVRGVPAKSIPLGEIANKTMQFGGKYRPVMGHGRAAITANAPGFAGQIAEVEVDQETGQVTVNRVVIAQDVGRAINPPGIEGQMMGGATQGLGWALYEDIVYDENGQVLTGTWAEYAVPHFDQGARRLETMIVEVPSDTGPFGARGVGEPPVIATAAAVANAIVDATGARLTDLPMTAPRILKAIQER